MIYLIFSPFQISKQYIKKREKYLFRYRMNISFGISDWSPESVYKASGLLSRPSAPTFSSATPDSIILN
jgi:hypothetical protein